MRIGIIGLGALGSSLGLALRAKREWADVTGYDAAAKVQNEAKRRNAIKEGTADIPDLLSDADLVVLAIPPLAVLDFLRDYGPRLRADSVVTDLASSKGRILAAAARAVPERSGFVGGHPLVTSAPGVEHAFASLYQGRPWCLTAGVGTPADRLERVSAMVEAAGAVPYFTDAAEHDSWAAAVDGLPLVLAAALARVVGASDAHRDIAQAAGFLFDDATRGLRQGGDEGRGQALTNGDALVSWLDRVLGELLDWRDAVADGDEARLAQGFADAAAARERWEQERKQGARDRA